MYFTVTVLDNANHLQHPTDLGCTALDWRLLDAKQSDRDVAPDPDIGQASDVDVAPQERREPDGRLR